MPTWWGKSSSKDVKKKTTKENFIDALQRFISSNDQKGSARSRGVKKCSIDTISEKGSRSRAESRSTSPSTNVSRCQSFADRPHAQPLPLPGLHPSKARSPSGVIISKPLLEKRGKPLLHLPLPKPDCVPRRQDIEGELATASVSSNCSIDSDDPVDSQLHSPVLNNFDNGNKGVIKNNPSVVQKDQSPTVTQKNSKEMLKPSLTLPGNQILTTSPKRVVSKSYHPTSQVPCHGAYGDSTMSSPSRSPMTAVCPEQIPSVLWSGRPCPDVTFLGSGQASPGSGQTSGHNSLGGDMLLGQLFWPPSRSSAECSPVPSPRMASPGPSSRIHSGAVSPLHPRAGGPAPASPTNRIDEGKKRSHRLPLPPINISHTSPFSPNNITSITSPSIPRSPGRTDNPASPGSRWKKGKLIGHGTYGHVYVGFNSESGEMCAMKEVTLFMDDAKSKESAKQLGQEISLLSRLRHQNIVEYLGCDTIDDKLYIYLEYVSGGSIYKLLEQYGVFSEPVIRSYTQQILSGLAFLHAKNTVHRDIKGANILVDPNGRVKLADFGMAKHITGQTCPLSFKGSPYWMAPEVIKNANGCNLAVDIWSLGCTVLEMATSKPPWSQYEGIAAMFKIGNSKELPAIPDELSDEGKDFVRQCLQRDPSRRPTAAMLLHHPFVKTAPPIEKSVLDFLPKEMTIGVSSGANPKGVGHARNLSSLDMEGLGIYQPRSGRSYALNSDMHAKNISCPVSPIGSPLLNSRSPQHLNGRMSPSPISSPRTTSGSSTPLTGGNGAIPFNHANQSAYLHEGFSSMSRSPSNLQFYGPAYHDSKRDVFQGMQQASHVSRERMASENGNVSLQHRRPACGNIRDPSDRQSLLVDCTSHQMARNHARPKPLLNLTPTSPVLGRKNGV